MLMARRCTYVEELSQLRDSLELEAPPGPDRRRREKQNVNVRIIVHLGGNNESRQYFYRSC